MNLELHREVLTEKSCKGSLWVDSQFECYTLEDPPRAEKIPGITGISAGDYEVVLNWSPRFQEIMPLLLHVKGFSGIRIHWGNIPEHTDGCILVGTSWTNDRIYESKLAYHNLMTKLKATEEEIWLHIIEDYHA